MVGVLPIITDPASTGRSHERGRAPGVAGEPDSACADAPVSVNGVPRLELTSKGSRSPRSATYDPKRRHTIRYRAKRHIELPHVVKFSGGRSSAMLLFILLENGLLDRARGDVVVFNNTSAEHPYTYRFVRDCMRATRRYGIPFFHVEFQTYEDARKGEWTRLPTYRLVNDRPWSEGNEDGFHWRGEVFEEMLSWKGYVPNQFSRICTKHLKLEVTRNFLRDWFAAKEAIPRLGHYGNGPRINRDVAYRRHRKNQGSVPEEIFLKKREYAWTRPHARPQQYYRDFCPSWGPFRRTLIESGIFGDQACFGEGVGGVEYVALIGLRSDEPHRIQRVEARGEAGAGYQGEHIYMPLHDMAVSRRDIDEFWESQSWNLELPKDTRLSNCVYCFLKGAANLGAIHASEKTGPDAEVEGFGKLAGTPADLGWWRRIEARYRRDLRAENRKPRTSSKHIGFFGNHPFDYDALAAGRPPVGGREAMPCECI